MILPSEAFLKVYHYAIPAVIGVVILSVFLYTGTEQYDIPAADARDVIIIQDGSTVDAGPEGETPVSASPEDGTRHYIIDVRDSPTMEN